MGEPSSRAAQQRTFLSLFDNMRVFLLALMLTLCFGDSPSSSAQSSSSAESSSDGSGTKTTTATNTATTGDAKADAGATATATSDGKTSADYCYEADQCCVHTNCQAGAGFNEERNGWYCLDDTPIDASTQFDKCDVESLGKCDDGVAFYDKMTSKWVCKFCQPNVNDCNSQNHPNGDCTCNQGDPPCCSGLSCEPSQGGSGWGYGGSDMLCID